MTNLDRIRAMSAEELVLNYHSVRPCEVCSYFEDNECSLKGYAGKRECNGGRIKWLNKKHIEPMPEIKAGDFIDTKTKEHGRMILVCVKEEEGKIMFCVDKEKCFSLSAFSPKEILKIYRYDRENHRMAEIWSADNG